jgi:hypothetical protein
MAKTLKKTEILPKSWEYYNYEIDAFTLTHQKLIK